jgi:hypothetical protein
LGFFVIVETAVPVVDAALNTTTVASHGVFAPVPTVAVAVARWGGTRHPGSACC